MILKPDYSVVLVTLVPSGSLSLDLLLIVKKNRKTRERFILLKL